MSDFRFSLKGLLLAVMNLVLLVDTFNALIPDQTYEVVARGNLSLCTLLFSLLCSLMERPIWRVLLFSAIFYFWGLVCLLLGNSYEFSFLTRLVLASFGCVFAAWSWLDPAELRDARIN